MTGQRFLSVAILVLSGVSIVCHGDDWAQWRGPDRTGISKEKGLVATWPAAGPKKLWVVQDAGDGYSSPSVVGDKVYVTGLFGAKGRLICYNTDGKKLWGVDYGPEWDKSYKGARSTPTVHNGKIFIMTAFAEVVCLQATDGKELWRVDTMKRFGAKNIKWGITESLLVENDLVVCTPGGSKAAIAALKIEDGSTAWTTMVNKETSAYCSPIAVNHGGKRMILTMTAKHVVGIDAGNGQLLWQHQHSTSYDVHAVTPLYEEGFVFISSGYGTGSAGLKLATDGKGVEQVWKDSKLDIHFGGAILLDGAVYGTGHKNTRGWACIDLKTGRLLWEDKAIGKGAVVAAGGFLYGYSEKGKVGLFRPGKTKCELISTFDVKDGTGQHWAHPVIANGVLYIRHGQALIAYKVGQN